MRNRITVALPYLTSFGFSLQIYFHKHTENSVSVMPLSGIKCVKLIKVKEDSNKNREQNAANKWSDSWQGTKLLIKRKNTFL